MRIGVDSNLEKEKLTNIEVGTLLWTAEYNSASDSVTPLALIFDGYVKAPSNKENSGVWGKVTSALKNSKGEYERVLVSEDGKEPNHDTHVTDLSVGVFFDKKSAIIAFKEEIKKIVKACDKALEELND